MSEANFTKKERHAYKVGYGAGIWNISLPDAISTEGYQSFGRDEKKAFLYGYIEALQEIVSESMNDEGGERGDDDE